MIVKHSEVKVKLIGNNGNAFVILAKVKNALERAKVPSDEIKEFENEATSGDYDHLLQTCCRWVTIL